MRQPERYVHVSSKLIICVCKTVCQKIDISGLGAKPERGTDHMKSLYMNFCRVTVAH